MTKEEIKSLVVKSSGNHQKGSGGQSVGLMPRDVTLELEGQIKIEIGFFRTMHQNLELASILMDLAIDELLEKYK